MYILNWNGMEAKIMHGDDEVLYTSYEKPKLSFDYIALYYEEPTKLNFYIDINNEKQTLTEEQIDEIKKYCDSFEIEQDYLVAVINEDRIYEHMEYKKVAEQEGLKYVFLNEPDPNDAIWRLTEDNTWEQIYAAFLEDGTPIYWPLRGQTYVLFMNENEYGALGERPTMAHTLNFVTMQWVDNRKLDRLKFHAKSDVMSYFQYFRAHNVDGRISVFEISTWNIQKHEAEEWLKNNSFKTPFIDGMLSELIDVEKETLCKNIVNHYSDEALEEMGKFHGRMYSYIYSIEHAMTIAEVDAIMLELQKYTKGKFVVNESSEYKPAVKAYGDSIIVTSDTNPTFYHSKLGAGDHNG